MAPLLHDHLLHCSFVLVAIIRPTAITVPLFPSGYPSSSPSPASPHPQLPASQFIAQLRRPSLVPTTAVCNFFSPSTIFTSARMATRHLLLLVLCLYPQQSACKFRPALHPLLLLLPFPCTGRCCCCFSCFIFLHSPPPLIPSPSSSCSALHLLVLLPLRPASSSSLLLLLLLLLPPLPSQPPSHRPFPARFCRPFSAQNQRPLSSWFAWPTCCKGHHPTAAATLLYL